MDTAEFDAELEYQEAREAYDEALTRLRAAKANRPPVVREVIPRVKRKRIEAAAEREACWAVFLAGERDVKVLAERFNRSVGWVHHWLRRYLRDRQFGPETAHEHKWRMWEEQRKREYDEYMASLAAVPPDPLPPEIREHLRKGGAVIIR
jgi:hypothetical protein